VSQVCKVAFASARAVNCSSTPQHRENMGGAIYEKPATK